MTKRGNFSDNFKAAVALEALRGDKAVQEIAAKRQRHPTQASTWKRQAIEGLAGVFSDKVKKAENKEGEIKDIHAKIGQLAPPLVDCSNRLPGNGQAWFSIFGGNHGLGDAQSADVAAFKYAGCQLLCRGTGGGDRQIWKARDYEYPLLSYE